MFGLHFSVPFLRFLLLAYPYHLNFVEYVLKLSGFTN